MVAMPKNALTHIQKIAPGPPEAMAVAAPAILPVPTCAAMAVASAWKELRPFSVLFPCREKFPNIFFIPAPITPEAHNPTKTCSQCPQMMRHFP